MVNILKIALCIKKYYLHYTAEKFYVVTSTKETVTKIELRRRAAQAPHVDGRAAPFAKEHLWRHVVQSVDKRFIFNKDIGKRKKRVFCLVKKSNICK